MTIHPHTAHERCRSLWGAAKECQCVTCGGSAQDWAYDGTDPSQIYAQDQKAGWIFFSRFPEFYMPLCRKCHNRRDGALVSRELYEFRMSKYVPPQQEWDLLA